jgi:ADP-heptose:LPS heptosyltransferase
MSTPQDTTQYQSQSKGSRTILVVRFGAMGDLLHVSPSIAALKESNPEVRVHFLTSPLYGELVGTFSGVDRVWTFDKKTGLPGLFQLAQALKEACPQLDSLINLHPSLRTFLLTMLLQPVKELASDKRSTSARSFKPCRLRSTRLKRFC